MPKGVGYGNGKRKNAPSKGAVKRAAKNAAKAVIKRRETPVPRRFGKAVMKEDPKKPGRKIGYATPGKTKLPPKKKVRISTKGGRVANRRARKL